MTIALSAVMFAFNEAEHLESVVRRTLDDLAEACADFELILVDDGSSDATPDILARLAQELPALRVITHAENRGIGEAVHTGYAATRKDWVCILPADGQITMSEYRKLMPAAEAGADFVMGRYGHRRGEVDSLHRVVLSNGLRAFMWVMLGVSRRIDSAFLFRRALLDDIPLVTRSFFVNLELPVRAIRDGYRVETVDMEVFPRISGSSKVVNWTRISTVGRDVVRLRMALWRERLAGRRRG